MASSIKSALLVIDMQNFFTTMTEGALPQVQTLIRHFNLINLPVIFTQHGHDEADLLGPPYLSQLVQKWGVDGSIHLGSKDWELQAPIKDLMKEEFDVQIVRKNTYDAFINTDLDERLKSMKVERVVVCGCMTDCCVDTTARGAFNRGWETWLVQDACGSANKAQHEVGLEGFSFAFGDIVTTADAVKCFVPIS
ncbi:Isochorismatase hydrolase [Annulohypoxylon maeteangense]|uniref:Isochorismatase hydrolase n=1 Tax=Annulohypoxylon maeteangense TaxID=1927788 RepID=UPI0020080A6A|nr:Isochorismatase hydrolase [Annulohypoxylon maeteangense]KAI0881400.1 Isochorismatase hydrolase [Annulohypoxylon maeteangense]